jgi:hypothetical protein
MKLGGGHGRECVEKLEWGNQCGYKDAEGSIAIKVVDFLDFSSSRNARVGIFIRSWKVINNPQPLCLRCQIRD